MTLPGGGRGERCDPATRGSGTRRCCGGWGGCGSPCPERGRRGCSAALLPGGVSPRQQLGRRQRRSRVTFTRTAPRPKLPFLRTGGQQHRRLTLLYSIRNIFATQCLGFFSISLDFGVPCFPDDGDDCNKDKEAFARGWLHYT